MGVWGIGELVAPPRLLKSEWDHNSYKVYLLRPSVCRLLANWNFTQTNRVSAVSFRGTMSIGYAEKSLLTNQKGYRRSYFLKWIHDPLWKPLWWCVPSWVTSAFPQRSRDSDCSHKAAGEPTCQAQNDINVEDHGSNDLLVSGRSPMYTRWWLNVRKTLAGLTFVAKKLHWPMSHFSFLLLYLICVNDPYFLIAVL